MKGERPREIVGLARTMRAARDEAVAVLRAGVRHLRHRRRPRAHVQRLDRRRAGARGVRRARRQARQPLGLEPLRQRRSVRGARRQHHGAARGRRTLPRRGRHRVLLRADLPSVDAARGADAQGARDPDGLQPARSADQSRRRVAAARRRAASGADRAGRPLAGAARRRARLGRARRGRPRRDLDHRLHQGVGVPRRRGQHVLRPSRRTSSCPRPRPRRCGAATRPRTPTIARRVLAGERGAGPRHRPAQRRRVAADRRRRWRRCPRASQRAAKAIDSGARRRGARPARQHVERRAGARRSDDDAHRSRTCSRPSSPRRGRRSRFASGSVRSASPAGAHAQPPTASAFRRGAARIGHRRGSSPSASGARRRGASCAQRLRSGGARARVCRRPGQRRSRS